MKFKRANVFITTKGRRKTLQQISIICFAGSIININRQQKTIKSPSLAAANARQSNQVKMMRSQCDTNYHLTVLQITRLQFKDGHQFCGGRSRRYATPEVSILLFIISENIRHSTPFIRYTAFIHYADKIVSLYPAIL